MIWNPRYVAYAKAHDSDPETILEADHERWPGGVMTGYIIWIQEKWNEWLKVKGSRDLILTTQHHEEFDRWLES